MAHRGAEEPGWNDGTPSAGPDWLEIHFASAQPINEIDVFSLQDAYTAPIEPVLGQSFSLYGVTDFQVQYWTGATWALVPGGSITGNTQVWRQLIFTPVTTTAIRIMVTGTVDMWTRLTEVEAYAGTPIATVAAMPPTSAAPTQAAATTNLTGAGLADRHGDVGGESDGTGWNVIGTSNPASGTSVAVGQCSQSHRLIRPCDHASENSTGSQRRRPTADGTRLFRCIRRGAIPLGRGALDLG